MNEQTTVETQPEQPEPALSISDHAAEFGPNAGREEPDGDDLKPIRPVDQQRRDAGKFAEGRRPMRSRDAVTRINDLTKRAKTAEEGWQADKTRLSALESELAALKATGASKPAVAAAEARVDTAQAKVDAAPAPAPKPRTAPPGEFAEPEPDENDPKYANDYGKYLRAAAAWEGRKSFWDARQAERHAEEEAKRGEVWDRRVAAAEAKYPDFFDVARRTIQRIPQGSPVFAWVKDDDLGEDVLYHLGSNPQELDAILQMPTAHQQHRALSLLSQRFASTPDTREAAGTTGAARTPKTVVLPKPPTPVRTEANRASDVPPPTDGTLSVADHKKAFHGRR
jgi:hypothetical protein